MDDLGIVRGINGKAYYIPAMSKIYIHNPEIFQFERLMIHENRNGIKLYDWRERHRCFLLSVVHPVPGYNLSPNKAFSYSKPLR